MWQAYTLAVLNQPGRQPKVAEVVCFAILEEAFCNADIIKLEPLVRHAEQWVHDAFDEACARMKADLESLSYEGLDAFGGINYVLPDEGDVTSPKPRA